jgi:ankyrin repeat protein
MNSIDQELFEAAAESNLPEVSRLLSVGADIEAKDSDGDTPLIVASIRGRVHVLQALREHGADFEATNNNGLTPLHSACLNGQLAVVIELSPNDSTGKRKSRAGANIEAKNDTGDTPLIYAAMMGHSPIVKALLAVGANILAANNQGLLPIHAAVKFRRPEVAKYLLQHFYATTTRRLPLHELLKDLTCNDDPDSIFLDDPPLGYALDENVLGTDDVVEILEFLVGQNPALLSTRDQDGSLPIHLACRLGVSFPIVQSLVDPYKASVKSLTPEGDLPLFLACEMPEPSLDIIFLLMKLYPDLVYR